jgi:hypothetical protein
VSTVLPRSTSAESYILFGNDAINGEWPWQALFFKDSSPQAKFVSDLLDVSGFFRILQFYPSIKLTTTI